MKIVLIDNYDSFTYNLYHYLLELGAQVDVYRNDQVTVDQIRGQAFDGIVISPGPCTPNEAGICLELIGQLKETVPILGVCLGFQSICQVFGGKIVRGEQPMHAVVSSISIVKESPLFHDLPSSFKATRYHSLVAEKTTLPKSLTVLALSEDGVVQSVAHEKWPVYGVLFHPESIASEYGHDILKNFLSICE